MTHPAIDVSLERIPLPPALGGMIDPEQLAQAQLAEAMRQNAREYSDAIRFAQNDLHDLVDAMIAGDLVIVGALPSNGKTAFLMSQMDYLAAQQMATLYVPLELDPPKLRRQWAAWSLRIDPEKVLLNRWADLPHGARIAHEAMMAEQAENPYVVFPDDPRVSLQRLEELIAWAKERFGIRCVMVDHFHRMDFRDGVSRDFRVNVTEVARGLKDLARKYGVVIIVAAQLNRMAGVDEHLDRYRPPQFGRLKESSALGEEADIVLVLSRRFRAGTSVEDLKAMRVDNRLVIRYEDPNVMEVTCRKRRIKDSARDRYVLLTVDQGRVRDRAPAHRIPPPDYNEPDEPDEPEVLDLGVGHGD